jgi:hypothetical protein
MLVGREIMDKKFIAQMVQKLMEIKRLQKEANSPELDEELRQMIRDAVRSKK